MSIKPVLSYDDILRTPESYNVIPIIKEISGDMDTPVSIFSAFKNERYSFLFESTEGVGRWGRYSFICLNPALTVLLYKGVLSTVNLTGLDLNIPENIKLDDIKQDIFSYVKTILLKLDIYKNNLIDGFIGGLFGYLGYEISGLIEKLPPDKKDVTDVYDLFFMLPRDVIVYDGLEQSIKIISFIFKDSKDRESLKKEYESALWRLNSLSDKIQKRDTGQNESGGNEKLNFEIIDEIEYEQFKNKVLAAKEYILRGDIFQVQISRRKQIINPPSPFLFYRALRLVNP